VSTIPTLPTSTHNTQVDAEERARAREIKRAREEKQQVLGIIGDPSELDPVTARRTRANTAPMDVDTKTTFPLKITIPVNSGSKTLQVDTKVDDNNSSGTRTPTPAIEVRYSITKPTIPDPN
jgi:hypothetical protein